MKLAGKLIPGLFLVLAAFLGHDLYKAKLALSGARQEAVKSDSLRQVSETSYLFEFDQRRTLENKNSKLLEIIDSKDEDIREYVRLNIEYRDTVIEGGAVATIDSGITKISYYGEDGGTRVLGWTISRPPSFYVQIFRKPLLLDIVTSQGKNLRWSTQVETNDPDLTISRIQTEVRPYIPPWYKNLKIYVGAGFVPGVGILGDVGVEYKDWAASWVLIDKYQGVIVRRRFGLW